MRWDALHEVSIAELEMNVLDWLGKAIGLPKEFLFEGQSNGGGVIQATASEATLTAMLAARTRVINQHKLAGKGVGGLECVDPVRPHAVVQKSTSPSLSSTPPPRCAFTTHHVSHCHCGQAHSSAEKGALIAGVQLRLLQPNTAMELEAAALSGSCVLRCHFHVYVTAISGYQG